MNFFSQRSTRKLRLVRTGLLLLALGFSFLSSGQSVLPGDPSRIQSGTIEKTREDDGYITISGWDYGFSNELTKVSYEGDEVGVEVLAAGFIVRYTLDSNNMLLTIEIIGPRDAIASLEDS